MNPQCMFWSKKKKINFWVRTHIWTCNADYKVESKYPQEQILLDFISPNLLNAKITCPPASLLTYSLQNPQYHIMACKTILIQVGLFDLYKLVYKRFTDVLSIQPFTPSSPYGLRHKKTWFFLHANNKGADQPVHLHRLVFTFVFGYLETSIFC